MRAWILATGCLLTIIFNAGTSFAQETCATLVQDALTSVSELCRGTGRNQACYGNLSLEAVPFDEDIELEFDQPGDLVNLVDVRGLHLSPLSEDNASWGVTLMRLQADLPDTLPGQNVTFVLFGDVEVESAVEADSGMNPMQAFYFRSGVGDSGCTEAPESGVLVQTPEGNRRINLTINGVDVDLGSTVFFQAVAGDLMYVNVLEGSISVGAFGFQRTVPAGTHITLPIDIDLNVSGPPGEIEPYDLNVIVILPIILLERPIVIIDPLNDDQIDDLDDVSQNEEPVYVVGAPPEIEGESEFLPFECATPTTLETGNRNYITQGSYGFNPYAPADHELGMSVPELMNAVSYGLTMDGVPLTPIGDRFLVAAGGLLHVQQMFAIGTLTPGQHILQLINSINGQAVATHSCTYSVEAGG